MTVPVPLTDLLAKADDQADDLGIVIVYPEQVRALCEALRIAVEGLDLIAADETGCCYEWWDTTCAKRGDPEPCHFCIVNERRAAVRELVDLGGNDGP